MLTVEQTGVLFLYSAPQLCEPWPWYVAVLYPLKTPIVLPITQIAMTGSVYSVVAVALERYFNICKPFRANWVKDHSVSHTANLIQTGNFALTYLQYLFFMMSERESHRI